MLADDFENPEKSNHIDKAFKDMIRSVDIGTNGYPLLDVQDTLTKKLKCHGRVWLLLKYLHFTPKGIGF